MKGTILASLLLTVSPVISEERYFVETTEGKRFLQLSTGNRPDLVASTDSCRVEGANFACSDTTRINADDGTYSDITVAFSCILDSFTGFDFRRSQGCNCMTEIVPSDGGPSKQCPCSICPFGFGDSPIAIDCSYLENSTNTTVDPFIVSTCTTLDCGFACNGTCSFDCEQSGPDCGFCEGNPGTSPTMAPTGDGDCDPATDPFCDQQLSANGGSSDAFLALSGISATVGIIALWNLAWL